MLLEVAHIFKGDIKTHIFAGTFMILNRLSNIDSYQNSLYSQVTTSHKIRTITIKGFNVAKHRLGVD